MLRNQEITGSVSGEAASDRENAAFTGNDDRTENRLHRSLISWCEKSSGKSVVDVSYPGGVDRASFRCELNDGSAVIVTRRENQHRALLEERVLSALGQGGAPVPQVLDFNGLVLLQSDEGKTKLSDVLLNCDSRCPQSDVIALAASSLLQVHEVAADLELSKCVPLLGCDPRWVRALIDRPSVIGSFMDVPSPVPDLEGMFQLLCVVEPGFVKWDSRPANAVVSDTGKMSWVDWEHAGSRNPIDDLVHLVCDENVSLDEQADLEILTEFAPRYSNLLSPEEAIEYCLVTGVLHFGVRLGLVLDEYDQYGWGDADRCARNDKIGSSKEQALLLCRRASHWASATPMTSTLAPWYASLGSRIAGLD